MSAAFSHISQWCGDFYLLATLLLAGALLLGQFIKQPARRIAIAWSTAIALAGLALLCALPDWSRFHLLEVPATTASNITTQTVFPETPTPFAAKLPETLVGETPAAFPATALQEIHRINWEPLVGLAALLGSAVVLLWLGIGAWQIRRLRTSAQPPSARVAETFASLLRPGELAPSLGVSNRLPAPVAAGLSRPIILLPAELAGKSSQSELSSVLAHELAHIRHHDLWLLAALRLLLLVLWAHPLFWLLRRHVRLDQETLADAAAADVTNRPDYAEQLVALARSTTAHQVPRFASSVGLWESPTQLKQRIATLLDEKFHILRTCSPRWRAGTLGALVSVAVGLSLVTLKPAASADPQLQAKIDNAINVIHQHQDAKSVDEWGQAVRTLIEIGPPAVPTLIAELDKETRDHSLRKLAFTLRGINDVRAIPALIRAIPRTFQPPANDYGLQVKNKQLFEFLKRYDTIDSSDDLIYGRAFPEVVHTLKKLSGGVSLGEMEINGVNRDGTPTQQAMKKRLYEQVAARWARWWGVNWEEFLSDVRYAKVGMRKPQQNSMALPNDAKTVRFPVGDDIRLGAESIGISISAVENPRRNCFLDLDTGRSAGWPDELPEWGTVDENSPEVINWARKNGFDLLCVMENANDGKSSYGVRMLDMRAWKITDEQLQELPRAMRNEIPYPLDAPVDRMEPKHQSSDYSHIYNNFEGNNYLFRTREGAYGFIKLYEPGDFPYPSVKAAYYFFIQDKSVPETAFLQHLQPPGTYFFEFSGVAPEDIPVLAKALHESRKPNTIIGLCTDGKGKLLEGVTIEIYSRRLHEPKGEPELILSTKSDREGRFRFDNLIDIKKEFPQGLPDENFPQLNVNGKMLYFIGRAPGRVSRFKAQMNSWIVQAGKEIVFKMPKAKTLRGRVTDDSGRPVENALVLAGLAIGTLTENISSAKTNAKGEYIIDDLEHYDEQEAKHAYQKRMQDAQFTVTFTDVAAQIGESKPWKRMFYIKHPDYALRRAEIDAIPGTVDVVLQPASVIEGQVVTREPGKADKPPANVPVVLKRVLSEKADPYSYQTETSQTDANGHYRFGSLPAGKYYLSSSSDGWVTHGVDNVEAIRGQTVEAPDIVFTRGGRVRLQLANEQTGKPITFDNATQANVNPQPLPRRSWFPSGSSSNVVKFSREGIGEFQLPAGRFTIWVNVPGTDNQPSLLTAGYSVIKPNEDDLKLWACEVKEGETIDFAVAMQNMDKESPSVNGTLLRSSSPSDEQKADVELEPNAILVPATPPAESGSEQ